MNNKEKRIIKFQELSELYNSNLYSHLVFSKPTLFKQEKIKKDSDQCLGIKFLEENVISTIKNSENAAVLVFCSAKNPGGGVMRGSVAQEEEISLHSSWYFQVKDIENFYAQTGDSAINIDKIIYIDQGYLLKDENFDDIEPLSISFIGSTAPNLRGLKDQGIKFDEKSVYDILEKRIRSIFCCAQENNKQNLILGAFGCGVFGLEPHKVAQCFKNIIEENLFSGNITFSIIDRNILNIFQYVILKQDLNHALKNKP